MPYDAVLTSLAIPRSPNTSLSGSEVVSIFVVDVQDSTSIRRKRSSSSCSSSSSSRHVAGREKVDVKHYPRMLRARVPKRVTLKGSCEGDSKCSPARVLTRGFSPPWRLRLWFALL